MLSAMEWNGNMTWPFCSSCRLKVCCDDLPRSGTSTEYELEKRCSRLYVRFGCLVRGGDMGCGEVRTPKDRKFSQRQRRLPCIVPDSCQLPKITVRAMDSSCRWVWTLFGLPRAPTHVVSVRTVAAVFGGDLGGCGTRTVFWDSFRSLFIIECVYDF